MQRPRKIRSAVEVISSRLNRSTAWCASTIRAGSARVSATNAVNASFLIQCLDITLLPGIRFRAFNLNLRESLRLQYLKRTSLTYGDSVRGFRQINRIQI